MHRGGGGGWHHVRSLANITSQSAHPPPTGAGQTLHSAKTPLYWAFFMSLPPSVRSGRCQTAIKTFIDHVTKTTYYDPPGFEPSPPGLRLHAQPLHYEVDETYYV